MGPRQLVRGVRRIQVVKLHLIKQGACQLVRLVRVVQLVKLHLINKGLV